MHLPSACTLLLALPAALAAVASTSTDQVEASRGHQRNFKRTITCSSGTEHATIPAEDVDGLIHEIRQKGVWDTFVTLYFPMAGSPTWKHQYGQALLCIQNEWLSSMADISMGEVVYTAQNIASLCCDTG
jgi:hypothetical protein